ncbi:MAG: helix-turn-helix transcriptional regulator, partial [Rhizobiales bacterium]|nr:helix-turn-helix transcriptional regulator [Hyphomicrobiales bacterium]
MADIADKKALGARIKALRKVRHWTQKELAQRLGIRFEQLNKYESGLNSPPVEMLVGANVMSPELHAASAAVSPSAVKTFMLFIGSSCSPKVKRVRRRRVISARLSRGGCSQWGATLGARCLRKMKLPLPICYSTGG